MAKWFDVQLAQRDQRSVLDIGEPFDQKADENRDRVAAKPPTA